MNNKISNLKIILYGIGKILKWIIFITLGLFIFFIKLLIEISKDY